MSRWMKELRAVERKQVEARLRDATPGFVPSAAEREEFDLASWRELRKLDPAIVSIGSHTLTHPILPSTPPAELEAEVRDSRRQLERGLQRPVDLFAYPQWGSQPRGRGLRAQALPRRGDFVDGLGAARGRHPPPA